ncbi:hypothetical protein LLS1_09400 [Leifsonia sp. LS1]|uniref:hypothetical protein n=1 Tax=Leifsonia sp. LS1 TaxID=2828483 RepID=UPI001CFEDEBE|nr:hypothetical protein [Leifsonia sp. LS1]GIT79271.1 hypothetical protein LLS1_09400 [Leifsonia sp. LS1]
MPKLRSSVTVTAAAVVAFVLSFGPTLAAAASPMIATDREARRLLDQLAVSPEPQSTFDAMSSGEQALVRAASEVATVSTTSDQFERERDARSRAASGCYSYTARSAFYNSIGQTLGSMWTTGQICYNGATVTSARYLDGGGSTSFIGWSYVGRTSSAAGVSGGGGYAYGAYKFRFALVAGFQEPIYCARVVGTSVAAHGDTRCGIG